MTPAERRYRNQRIRTTVPLLVASWTKPAAPRRIQRAAYREALEVTANEFDLSVEAIRHIIIRGHYETRRSTA